MVGLGIDLTGLQEAAEYQRYAQEKWIPTQFPSVDSTRSLMIKNISVLDWNQVVPDENGFMFSYPERSTGIPPYHEQLEEALKVYLAGEEINEAAKIFRNEGRQVYAGKGIVLVKTGYGVWSSPEEQIKRGRFEARCKIIPTIDLAPYIKQTLAIHPELSGLLNRLRDFKEQKMPESSLLPECAELVKWEKDKSFGNPSVTSTFQVGNFNRLGLQEEVAPLTLLYRSEGLRTEISLPSVRKSTNHYNNLVLATIKQKLPASS